MDFNLNPSLFKAGHRSDAPVLLHPSAKQKHPIHPNPNPHLHHTKVIREANHSFIQPRPSVLSEFWIIQILLIIFSSKRSSAEKRTPVVGGSRGITDNLLNIGKPKKQHNVLSTDNLLNIGSR